MAQADICTVYRVEANELLTNLESTLLELENDPANGDLTARAFRSLHTLKGSGGMAGFLEVVRFAHDLENLFDRVRNGKMAVTPELLSITLTSKDHLQALVQVGPECPEELTQATDELLARLRASGAGSEPNAKPGETAAMPVNKPVGELRTYWLRFRPDARDLLTGANPLALLQEVMELGTAVERFHGEAIPPLTSLEPDRLYSWWDIILNTDKDENAIRDIFIFVDTGNTIRVKELGRGGLRAGDLAVLRGVIDNNPSMPEESLLELLLAQIRSIVDEIAAKRRKNKPGASSSEADSGSSIRVDSERLDKLVDMVGELVIIQARLSMSVNRVQDATLSQIAEDMERLSDSMRGTALGMRMVPIDTTFNVFRRLVRDLAISLHKDVALVTEGGETEMDKTVIDRLKDPLLHIMRNALDHGLETPEERRASGKPEQGTLRLGATNSGGDVLITIADDGRGINAQKVRQRAIERGLITAEAVMSEQEIFALLFEPGFSTAEKVSDISGRGVGMDVVRRGIDALRGTVEIRSVFGKGTTIAIRLPLTLAIIDGMLVEVGKESFIIPLSTVEACQERYLEGSVAPEVGTITRTGHMIPCISLRRLMNIPGEQPDYERVIIATVDNLAIGLAVDRVVGRQQAVIKSLSGFFRNLNWISGTTINGDGGISLIVDVPQLVRYATAKAAQAA